MPPVEPHAAAGDLRHLVLRGEAGQEEKLEQLQFGKLVGHLLGDESARDGLGPQLLDVDPAAVIGERDVEHAGAVAGLEPDRADRRLVGGLPVGGRLQPMVEGVADEMRKRRLEFVEDVAIDAGLFAAYFPANLLAEGAGDVADEPRETADAVGQRPHAAHDHLLMEAAGEILVSPRETLEVVDLSHEGRQAGFGPLPHAGKHAQKRWRHRDVVGLELLLHHGDRVAELDLRGPQGEQGIDEGPQLSRFHERLAREADEPGQAVGRYPHHPVGLFDRAGG